MVKIVTDTKTKYPVFSDQYVNLEIGQYALAGVYDVAVIVKQNPIDLFNSLIGRHVSKFMSTLNRAARYKCLYVCCSFSLGELISFPNHETKWEKTNILKNVSLPNGQTVGVYLKELCAGITRERPNVKFIFAGKDLKQTIYDLLSRHDQARAA